MKTVLGAEHGCVGGFGADEGIKRVLGASQRFQRYS